MTELKILVRPHFLQPAHRPLELEPAVASAVELRRLRVRGGEQLGEQGLGGNSNSAAKATEGGTQKKG